MLGCDHRGGGASLAPVEAINFEALVTDVFVPGGRPSAHYDLPRVVVREITAFFGTHA